MLGSSHTYTTLRNVLARAAVAQRGADPYSCDKYGLRHLHDNYCLVVTVRLATQASCMDFILYCTSVIHEALYYNFLIVGEREGECA